MKRLRIMKMIAIYMLTLATAFFFSIPAYTSVQAGDITGGAKAPHINIAIFHKLHGHDTYTYPEHIQGHDILVSTHGEAQLISLNHSSGLKDGDVISLSNDVLRDNSGAFQDFGVDCQLGTHMEENAMIVSGMCSIHMIDQDGRKIKHLCIVKPVQVELGQGWVLLYNDVQDGIAVYASGSIGME